MGLRATVHQVGAARLEQLLQYQEPDRQQRHLPCPCGETARYVDLRSKVLLTVLGAATLRRPYHLCAYCKEGHFPVDSELDLKKTSKSPGVRRMLAVVGLDAPFDRGRQQIQLLAGLEITAKEVERTAEAMGEDLATREREQIQRTLEGDLPMVVGEPIPILYVQMDGTGVPVVQAETVDRPGKREGQPAHTREAQLGCVFTQTKWNPEGYAIRDPDSTTYVGAIETAAEFGARIYREAWKRGWGRAVIRVVMGDGAEWIWNLALLHFFGAILIVDLFHARQHLWIVARLLHPGDDAGQKQWMLRHQPKLDDGKIEELVAFLRALEPSTFELAEKIQTEAAYFERNAERMRYPEFRRQHLFVGTGVIEAGCKTVIGSRLKQSGMFWTVRGANSILALRCCYANDRFEDYWEARTALNPNFHVAHPLPALWV